MNRAAPGTRRPHRLGVRQYFDGTRLRPGDIEIADGVVTAVGLPPGETGTACRGWLDLQVNGFAGVDVLHAGEAELRTLARRIVQTGVTALLPTVITSAAQDSEAALTLIDRVRESPGPQSAHILGTHLEGPLLSPAYAGAHRKDLLSDDGDRLACLVANHSVAMTTLAPELVTDQTIAALAAAGSVVSIGHTAATAARSAAAFAHGAAALTHAFNAHRPVTAREAGPLGAALVDSAAVLTVIADGIHVAAENLRILHRAAPGRLALVTDGIVAAGLGDGSYRFGPLAVEVTDGRALLPDGTLAGSVATLDRCVRHAAALWGIEAALRAVTTTPAALIGRPEFAVLAVGSAADLVRLDEQFAVAETYVAGTSSWQRTEP